MTRPPLTPDLLASDFLSFYWLKQELLDFCRAEALSTQGSKGDLTERIATFLTTGERPAPPPKRPRAAPMPVTLTRDSVIGPGWRCSEPLRAFFRSEIGPHFHFDQRMRDFIAQEVGKTLQEAIEMWEQPRPTTSPIAPQFEYNRHMRAFYERHPNATRAEAIQVWNEYKAQRRAGEAGTEEA